MVLAAPRLARLVAAHAAPRPAVVPAAVAAPAANPEPPSGLLERAQRYWNAAQRIPLL